MTINFTVLPSVRNDVKLTFPYRHSNIQELTTTSRQTRQVYSMQLEKVFNAVITPKLCTAHEVSYVLSDPLPTGGIQYRCPGLMGLLPLSPAPFMKLAMIFLPHAAP